MKNNLSQINIWNSIFGKEYTKRNTFTNYSEWNNEYKKKFGITKENLNKIFLNDLSKKIKILELGCNIGNQLFCLKRMGFNNLTGIEIQKHCLKKIKKKFKFINAIQGTTYNLPFNDNSFDLVFTSNVLIHIPPKKLNKVLNEMYRVSSKWIWGFEYFSEKYNHVTYRGKKNLLWKANFFKNFLKKI